MGTTVSKIINLAQSWIGKNENDSTHKEIIDIYNSQKPLARGYAVKYTDSWCATFISALAIKLGATDIIPTECGCGEMIELCKKLGIFVENDAYVPTPGTILFYDWQDNGNGDNTGWADHVGLVEKVEGNAITVIEGNHDNAVKRRVVSVNQRYIRGYACPKYDAEPTSTETSSKANNTVKIELSVLRNGSKGEQVKTLQTLLMAKGYEIGTWGIDGDFGNDTEKAFIQFQKDEFPNNPKEWDGVCGEKGWSKLLK